MQSEIVLTNTVTPILITGIELYKNRNKYLISKKDGSISFVI